MPELLEHIGRLSFAAVWVPILIWSVLAAAAMTVLKLLRKLHPAVHYQVRMALLLALPLSVVMAQLFSIQPLDLTGFAGMYTPTSAAGAAELSVNDAETEYGSTFSDSLQDILAHVPFTALAFFNMLATLLLIGACFILLYKLGKLQRIRRSLSRVDDPRLLHKLDMLAASLRIGRNVQLFQSHKVHAPLTFGWRQPCLVLPGGNLENAALSDREIELIFMHELIHIRRFDYLWSWTEELIRCLFFFHPAVHYLIHQIRLYREITCDVEVLATRIAAPQDYAILLYQSAYPARAVQHSGLFTGIAHSTSNLKQRIAYMHRYSQHIELSARTIRSGRLLAGVLLVGTVLAASCEMYTPGDRQAEPTPGQATGQLDEGDTRVLEAVDTTPQPLGGMRAIYEKLEYPGQARAAGVEGQVVLQFIVTEQGTTEQLEVLQGIGSGADEAAIQAIQSVNWEPGRHEGEPVAVRFQVPIQFRLQDGLQETEDGDGDEQAQSRQEQQQEQQQEPLTSLLQSLHAQLMDEIVITGVAPVATTSKTEPAEPAGAF